VLRPQLSRTLGTSHFDAHCLNTCLMQASRMKAVASYSLVALGVIACLVTGPMAFALSASPSGDGPVLVIAAPWNGGAASVVQAAGGRIIGPTAAPLSVLCRLVVGCPRSRAHLHTPRVGRVEFQRGVGALSHINVQSAQS
jgi:hypothetical protein